MTISEMHQAIKLELDKTSALVLPAFEPEEIDFWLNRGIRAFVKNRFSGMDKGQGFEMSTKRIADLRTLVIKATFDDSYMVTNTANETLVDISALDDEYWFPLGEMVDITYTSLTGAEETKTQGVTQCTVDTYRTHLDDPYSEHRLHYEEAKPLRLVEDTSVILVTDGNYTIVNYILTYLRMPVVVSIVDDIDCDLPEHTHDEIIKRTANMMLENIEQPRYQTHQYELNKVE